MPRKKKEEFPLKSIWELDYLQGKMNERYINKMYNWLIMHLHLGIDECPFESWSVKKSEVAFVKAEFVKFSTKIVEVLESARGGDTTKLLIELQDGHRVETVIMRHQNHNTVCVSSQIGCKMGCKFCATGTMGIIGDLTSGEIIEQLVHANSLLEEEAKKRKEEGNFDDRPSRIRNVVFMGMGEPLNNFPNVLNSVKFMINEQTFGLSPRQVTVSTVGVVDKMKEFTDSLPNVNLALSLHAPNQEVRLRIVPAASSHHINKLLEAIDYHISQNAYTTALDRRNGPNGTDQYRGRKSLKTCGIMIEYILISGVNDLEEHAHELGQLLSSRRGYILLNLIPYNPTEVAEDFVAPSHEDVERFDKIVRSEPYNLFTRVRRDMGQDVAAACGQLAVVSDKKKKKGGDAPKDIEDYGSNASKAAYIRKRKIKLNEKNTRAKHDPDDNENVAEDSTNANGKIEERNGQVSHYLNGWWSKSSYKIALTLTLPVVALLVFNVLRHKLRK